MPDPTATAIERCFQAFEAAAAKGERCPKNDANDIRSDYAVFLAHAGRIRVHIHGKNFRVVVILEGPHLGKWTAPDPNKGRLYRIIDQNGDRFIPKSTVIRRRAPSAPQPLRNPGSPNASPRGLSGQSRRRSEENEAASDRPAPRTQQGAKEWFSTE